MNRRFVILVCVLNTCLAGALIWYVFAAQKQSKPVTFGQHPPASETRLSDAALWAKAEAAQNVSEALHYLGQFQDASAAASQTQNLIENVSTALGPDYKLWPLYQASMQYAGTRASAISQLAEFAAIAMNAALPLTLRDTAFRTLIENGVRLNNNAELADIAFELIDRLAGEANQLKATALHAELYLANNAITVEDRSTLFHARLVDTVSDSNELESTRLSALTILMAQELPAQLDYPALYVDAPPALQLAVLKTIATKGANSLPTGWINEIDARTLEQEQLIQQILALP
jgi:hypothetical protein